MIVLLDLHAHPIPSGTTSFIEPHSDIKVVDLVHPLISRNGFETVGHASETKVASGIAKDKHRMVLRCRCQTVSLLLHPVETSSALNGRTYWW
jgi:hypothetical protein